MLPAVTCEGTEAIMTIRGRSQDRKRVAAGQEYELRYEAEKAGRSKKTVNRAVKKVGNGRKKLERRLAR